MISSQQIGKQKHLYKKRTKLENVNIYIFGGIKKGD